jgi:hypothetical protein
MIVITVADNRSKCFQLERSLNHFGWQYHIIEVNQWQGFAMKLNKVYEYLKANPTIKEFIFVDAYDAFFLDTPENTKRKLYWNCLFNSEVNCWPDVDQLSKYEEREQYTKPNTKFRFLNSGAYYMQAETFIKLIDKQGIHDSEDDQRIATKWLLDNPSIGIDHDCRVFQTLCGILPTDYKIENNIFITKDNFKPTIIHGNGKADMNFIYELIQTQ